MWQLKLFVIGLLVFVAAHLSWAQNNSNVHMSLTINPSINWLKPANDGFTPLGPRIGASYGLLMDFRLFGVNNYFLSTGFTFSHSGGKWSAPDVYKLDTVFVASRRNSIFSFTNIDIPLVIRLKTNEIGYHVFYGVFGTELGINLNAKEKYTHTFSNTTTGEKEIDISDEVNVFRSSLVIGAGIEHKISGNTYYRIGLTYHNGLTNMFNKMAFLVDENGNTVLNNGVPVTDRKLSSKLKIFELNCTVVF